MTTTRYSHAFLVGRIITNVADATLVKNGWEHVVIDENTYSDLCNYYFQGHVNAMVECPVKPASFPSFLAGIRHFSLDVNKNTAISNYSFRVCQFHLFFFPLDITLLAIEIDDSHNALNDLTLGHSQLMGWKDNFSNFPVCTKAIFKALDILYDNDANLLCIDGNKLKLYQIINIPKASITDRDSLLYELATSSPIGSVDNDMWISPSHEYYSKMMEMNSVSAFKDWKALALNDSFTMLDSAEKSPLRPTWDDNYKLWLLHYFRLIYLRCFFEKTFCLSRNIAYRQGHAVENLSSEIADMERYYFYRNISYNFLPNMLYDAMSYGLGIAAEREEMSIQIKERAKEEEKRRKDREEKDEHDRQKAEGRKKENEEKRFNNILSYATIFAVFSVAWDLCSMLKDALCIEDNKNVIAWIFITVAILFIIMLIYMIKNNMDIVDLYKKIFKKKITTKRIIVLDETREHLALHFQRNLPGSKFYCESPDALIELAKQQFPNAFKNAKPDADGRYRISLTFPNEIGVSNVVSIDELTDKERDRIEIIDRQGKKVRSVKTDRVIPTHDCQIILSADWHLITMFPGEMAPPLPDSLDIHDDYWDNHVFIETENK